VLIPNKAEINADFVNDDTAELKEVNSLVRVDSEINFLSAVEDAESALRMINKSDIEKMVNINNPNPCEEVVMKAIIVLKKGHAHVVEEIISEFIILVSDINFKASLLGMDVFALDEKVVAKISKILKSNKLLN